MPEPARAMDIYTEFAPLYDRILRHVDYERWYRYIRAVMLAWCPEPKVLLELGCGTGRFGAKFSRDDCTIYGMDRSLDMLRVARMRAYKNLRIFCGDLRAFAIARPADFIFAVHDTLNYLLTPEDFMAALRSIAGAMHRDSVFLFDITTEFNIKKNFEHQVNRYTVGGVRVTWSNRWDAAQRLIYSHLVFDRPQNPSATEEHVQRIYSVDEVAGFLERAGFRTMATYGDYTFDPVNRETVMINFVVRKKS